MAKRSKGDKLEVHHVPQKHVGAQNVPGYNKRTAPAIAVPADVHRRVPTLKGAVATSPRDQLAKDIRDLRAVGAPNASLKRLARMNKSMYGSTYAKGGR